MNAVHAASDFYGNQRAEARILRESADRCSMSPTDDGRAAERVVGASAAWRDVLRRAERVAATEATTCPQGESGTNLEDIERRTIERVLRESNGNKQLAARKLGISRMQLYTRLRRYGLEAFAASAVEVPIADDALATQ